MKPTCLLCEKPAHASGLCHTHGERWRRWGRPPLAKWVADFKAGRLNTCAVCGRIFNGYFGATTCGPKCKAERHRKTSLARFYRLPGETRAEYERRRRARYAAEKAARPPLPPVACPVCGTSFVPATKAVRYCSADCRRIKQATQSGRHRSQRATINLEKTLDQ